LATVYFDFDEAGIRNNQETVLEDNAACLSAFRDDHAIIEGHCDDRGTESYNLALGERRARSVRDYLERLGIESERLTVVSYGELRPAARGSNESAWRLNRRAEFLWD